ncbi:MAG: transglutaminase-like domain-containing protein [Pseudonocardia sp.]
MLFYSRRFDDKGRYSVPQNVECRDVGNPGPDMSEFRQPGRFVDSDSPAVRAFAAAVVGDETDPVARAVRLFEAVRDRFWYDPFATSTDPAAYTGSATLAAGRGWCIPKAVLLCAAARAVGIPAKLGFADVRNHLQTPRMRERMNGIDLFVFHGYTVMYLERRWVKAAPAFNAELCARFGVPPLAFDGRSDALMHQYTPDGAAYMEYVRDRGTYADLPLEHVLSTLHEVYGTDLFDPVGDNAGPDELTGFAPAR